MLNIRSQTYKQRTSDRINLKTHFFVWTKVKHHKICVRKCESEKWSCHHVTQNEWIFDVNMSRNAGLFLKIKTFHIFDILCWFSIMFYCCMCCILEQCLNSNINNSIKFTFFHLKCPIFIICDVAWGMTPCVTCLRVKDDGCTRWLYASTTSINYINTRYNSH